MTTEECTAIGNQLSALSTTAHRSAVLVFMGDHGAEAIQQDVTAMRAQLGRISRLAAKVGGQ